MHPHRTSSSSRVSIPMYAGLVIGLCSLACSTGSSTGGLGVSGITSTTQQVVGTKEERQQRKLDKICDADHAERKGRRNAVWGVRYDDAYLDECPADTRPDLVAAYEAGYDTGVAELAESQEYWAEQRRACDPDVGYETGYNDGLASAGLDSSFADACQWDDERQAVQDAYRRGYKDGEASATNLVAAEQTEVQAGICDPQRAFEIGQNDAQAHAPMSSAYLDQCADPVQREDARFQYQMGYHTGFGFTMIEGAQQREVILRERLASLPEQERAACDLDTALTHGYDDGLDPQREADPAYAEDCIDPELKTEAKARYTIGYEEGVEEAARLDAIAAHEEGGGATQLDEDEAAICDAKRARQRGVDDAMARRPMTSSWLDACHVADKRTDAKKAYRDGYVSAIN